MFGENLSLPYGLTCFLPGIQRRSSSMWRMGAANFFLRVLLSLGMIGLFSSTMRATAAQTSPKLADIIDKAAKEGEIVYQAPDPDTGLPTGEFLRDMSALTEKHFGVKIRVKIDNSLNFPDRKSTRLNS